MKITCAYPVGFVFPPKHLKKIAFRLSKGYFGTLFWVTLIKKKISILLSACSLKTTSKGKWNINAGQSPQLGFL